MKQQYIRIGHVVKPQGIKGEAKILSLSDDINRFDGLTDIFIEQDGRYKPAKLTVNRLEDSTVFAYIEGCYTREAVESIRNAYICVEHENAIPLDEYSWFIQDLEGLDVQSDDESIGVLKQVIQTGAVDVYLVAKHDGGSMLFPALKRVIKLVDVEKGHMILDAAALNEVAVHED